MKKHQLIITIVLLCSLLVSCDLINSVKEPKPTKLSDNNFNGVFVYNDSFYERLTFDGTNKFKEYSKFSDGNTYSFEKELKLTSSNDKTYLSERLWNNEYSNWSDPQEYLFLEGGNVLLIESYTLLDKTHYRMYVKQGYSVSGDYSNYGIVTPSSPSYGYVLNTNTMIVHRDNCSRIKQMSYENMKYSSTIPKGYIKCSFCFDI